MHDAELAGVVDPQAAGMQRVEPHHIPAWIYRDGGWRRGSVHAWWRDGDRWFAWMQHRRADENDPLAEWHLYVYSPKTIRKRYDRAPRVSVVVSSAWGPCQTVKTQLRNLGYEVERVVTGEEWDVLTIG